MARDRFPGGEFTNLLISCLNDSNEGIMGGEAEMRGFMVKCGERPLEGVVCEIPMRPPINDGAMESMECTWVDIWYMLDWIIGLCRKMAEMHFPGMGCSTSEMLLCLTEMELIASGESHSTWGASHQPAFMSGCLTISHTCLQ